VTVGDDPTGGGAAGSGRPGDPLVPPGTEATLLLLRHGETELLLQRRFQGRSETPLSGLGRRQAAAGGARIADPSRPPALPLPAGPPRLVAHSPLRRTAETAAAVSAALEAAGMRGIPVLAEPALAEIHQGAWEGLTQEEVAERYAGELAAWRRRPWEAHAPGGEDLADVDRRVRAGVRPLLERLTAGTTPGTLDRPHVLGYGPLAAGVPWCVLVGHDGCFKVLLLALLDLPLEAFWRFPFALAAISVVEIRGGRAWLRLHNAADHLAPLEEGGAEPARAPGAL
jgi:broad specificity phosphatase PhoE